MAGAGVVPLSQATLLQINPPKCHGHAMALFGIGTLGGLLVVGGIVVSNTGRA